VVPLPEVRDRFRRHTHWQLDDRDLLKKIPLVARIL
jgi:hypothetical protein